MQKTQVVRDDQQRSDKAQGIEPDNLYVLFHREARFHLRRMLERQDAQVVSRIMGKGFFWVPARISQIDCLPWIPAGSHWNASVCVVSPRC